MTVRGSDWAEQWVPWSCAPPETVVYTSPRGLGSGPEEVTCKVLNGRWYNDRIWAYCNSSTSEAMTVCIDDGDCRRCYVNQATGDFIVRDLEAFGGPCEPRSDRKASGAGRKTRRERARMLELRRARQ